MKARYLTDSMTGLANRRYFDEVFKKELFKLRLSESTLSIIMLDLDYFKKFNDTYGHLAGDQCLKKIAKAVKTIIKRSSDTLARYGGEEFIVILPGASEDDALYSAKKGGVIVVCLALYRMPGRRLLFGRKSLINEESYLQHLYVEV